MNARASYTSGPEYPSLHAQDPEPRFPCQPLLAPRRWTPRSAATTGGRASRRCRGAPELRPPPESGLLPFVSNAGEHSYEIPSTSSFRSDPWPKQPGYSRMFLGLCFFNSYFTAESHKLTQISHDLFTSFNPGPFFPLFQLKQPS
jgi:hypothetical protein